MNKLFAIGALFLSLGLVSFQTDEVADYCQSTTSRSNSKEALAPFNYDAGKTNKFKFTSKEQFREIEVPLFIGEDYRFVFNTEGLPQPIKIEIFDKKSTAKNRKLLFSNADITDDQFIFEPEKSKKLYVDYTVPPTNDEVKKGCVVFVVGYQSKFKKGEG